MSGAIIENERAATRRFVDAVVSPRARGLSVRLNLNPDGGCNFDCCYCNVDRKALLGRPAVPDVRRMIEQLRDALERIRLGRARELPGCEGAPAEYLKLGHVALSGDGEPTLCPLFEEVVESVTHLRAQGGHGFFKIALITNGSALGEARVVRGLKMLTARDEVWAKLDAGTPGWFRQINRAQIEYSDLLESLRKTGRSRPLVLQALFPRWEGRPVPLSEQDAFGARIAELKSNGAQIDFVQVYSAARTPASSRCGHASLAELSAIARRVREVAEVPAGVF